MQINLFSAVLALPVGVATVRVSKRVSDGCGEALEEGITVLHAGTGEGRPCEVEVYHSVDVDYNQSKRNHHLKNVLLLRTTSSLHLMCNPNTLA